jgi:predicted TIM-barrel fold metal-dependent hydrolase
MESTVSDSAPPEIDRDYDKRISRLRRVTREVGTVTFLPEPARRDRRYTLISVDDHIVEPPDMFEGRMPARYLDQAPRVVEQPGGRQVWFYDGVEIPNVGMNATAGRPVKEYTVEPTRFDEMRRGAWDIDYRIGEMDLNGIYASVNFPSMLAGFAGQRLQLAHDPGLALAAVRAWNDYILEVWAGRYPDRIIPMQLPYLLDAPAGAEEIRINAARGFKAVAFTESPGHLGLPSIFTSYWDPFFGACEETETAVCLHFGSASTSVIWSPDAVSRALIAYAAATSMLSATDWLFAEIPVRFPRLKIALSEGGIGWVAAMHDRLDHMNKYDEQWAEPWACELTPSEVLQRNFWLCALDEPSAMVTRHRIGVDRILLESDYPHADGSWPDSQTVLGSMLAPLPDDEVRRISWQNASELFRHPVPAAVQADPDAY